MRNPVKTAKRQLLRVGSCALSALMVLGSIPAAAIGDGVTATYDEAYYAMTDYYGNLTDGSVVKSYRTNGIATLTDYGDYDEIINLTDGTMPARNGGMTTFRLDEKALRDDPGVGLDGLMEMIEAWLEVNNLENFIRAARALWQRARAGRTNGGSNG